jgi:hypothetical protein
MIAHSNLRAGGSQRVATALELAGLNVWGTQLIFDAPPSPSPELEWR